MENPNPAVDVRAHLARTVFALLPENAMDQLVAASRVERYEVPSLVNAAHAPFQWLRLVVEGSIDIMARRSTGQEVAIGEFGPGGWVTWLACFMRMPPEHDHSCAAHTTCIALPVATVRQLFAAHPALFPPVIEDIGSRMRLLMQWTGQSVTTSPVKRMAKLIGILLEAQGARGTTGDLRATQDRLAKLARCSRQSANQLLGELEGQGLIHLAYGRIEVPDTQRLADFSEE